MSIEKGVVKNVHNHNQDYMPVNALRCFFTVPFIILYQSVSPLWEDQVLNDGGRASF